MKLVHILILGCVTMAVSIQGQQLTCGKADILLVLDTSGSVSQDYPTEKSFAANLTSGFPIGPNAVQFAVLLFSSGFDNIFGFNAYQTSQSLKEAIQNLPYNGDGTATGLALEAARLYSFTPENGARPNITKIAVIITDGNSNNGIYTAEEAAKLQQSGVTVFAVAVGTNIGQEELRAIATTPQHVFNVNSFDILNSIKDEIQSGICLEIISSNTPSFNGSCMATSCLGREDGNYPAPDPECQQGYYYICMNEFVKQMHCPLGHYKDANGSWYLARMVYNPVSSTCELESPSCPRNTSDYLEQYTPCPPMEFMFLLDRSENAAYASSKTFNRTTRFAILEDAIRSFLTNPKVTNGQISIRIGAFGYTSGDGNKEIIPTGSTPQDALSRVNDVGNVIPGGSWTYKGLEQITRAPTYSNNLLIVISSQGSGKSSRRAKAETEAARVMDLGWKPYVIAVEGSNPLDIPELTSVNNGTHPVVLKSSQDMSGYTLLSGEFVNIIDRFVCK